MNWIGKEKKVMQSYCNIKVQLITDSQAIIIKDATKWETSVTSIEVIM